jgi:hypothetical protein
VPELRRCPGVPHAFVMLSRLYDGGEVRWAMPPRH